MLSLLFLGLALGARHATDPDHVAAVTAIVSKERSIARAGWVGALWGLGHSLTILLAGSAIVAFRFSIPPRVGLAAEMLVALMLIALGALAIRRGGHSHSAGRTLARPVAIGVVHGLAGSAFVSMLVLTTAPHALAAVLYLAVFGIGTIAGMALITAGIAAPALLAARRFAGAPGYFRLASGVASIAIGLLLAHQVGFVDGLFSASPSWTPQ